MFTILLVHQEFHFILQKTDSVMLYWINNIHLYKCHGIEYGKSLQARFYGIPLDLKKY